MANRTIFLTYEDNGIDANAYSVELASEDGSYGIKEQISGDVAVSSGTAVSNPSTGRYEYTTSMLDDTKIYVVSWKIIPNQGDQPIYQVDNVGPFTTNASSIRAASDYRGTFIQGTTATLMLKITNFDSLPQDASSVTISISDPNGATIDSGIPEKATKGFYIYDWSITTSQTTGDYVATWIYTVNGVVRVEKQTFVVSTNANDTELYSGQAYELRLALESYLSCSMAIPVYYEQARPTTNYQTYRFSFPRWNQTAGVKIYRNNNIVDSGIDIDYFNGEVRFDQQLTAYDIIHADYNFRWFSDEDLHRYLENAVRTLNSYPPHSGYTILTLADRYIPIVIKQAAVDAIRHIMMCLQFQQPQQVFGGADGASKAFGNLETLKQNYEKEVNELYQQKKLGPYVGLTRSIVVPEYTLPGGRSRWFRYLFSTNA